MNPTWYEQATVCTFFSSNHVWQPLAVFSKKLSTEECIYNAIQHFRHILEGYPFNIYTDHKPLTHAFTLKKEKLPAVQLNQLSFISQFTTDIDYIEGFKNMVADGLSRVEAILSSINYEDSALP